MNWKTTLSGIGAALASALTVLAALPYDSGLQLLPPEWRSVLIKTGVISALLLKVVNSLAQADAGKTVPPPSRGPSSE